MFLFKFRKSPHITTKCYFSSSSSRQQPRGQTISVQRPTPLFTALERHSQIHIVIEAVKDDQRPRAIGIQKRHDLDRRAITIVVRARRRQSRRAPLDVLGKLTHKVVVERLDVRACIYIDLDDAAAGSAATGQMGAVGRRAAERPREGAGGPILYRSHDKVDALVPGGLGRGPTFGHILSDVWVLGVEVGEYSPVVVGRVAMPSDSLDVCACPVEDGLRVRGYVCRVG